MKETWYRIIELGYVDSPTTMWEDRHVRVTIGLEKIGCIFYLFNPEPNFKEFTEYVEDGDYSTQYEVKKTFDDIKLGFTRFMGVCGNLEILRSDDNPNEFKIEFL